MKITFLSPSLSREIGGIFEVERRLAQSLASLPDTTLEVMGVSDHATTADLPEWLPLVPHSFSSGGGPAGFRYSGSLERAILASDCDLLHLHSLWTHNSVIANKWAAQRRRPYVITAHGMLDEWAVRNSGWKKRITLGLYERKLLTRANCIHVFSQSELGSVRNFGLRNPVCVIPNGVDLPGKGSHGNPFPAGQKTLLYLGRLHPKKGLLNLIKAWVQVRTAPWVLAIAGWDQGEHEKELRELAAKSNGLSSIMFLGPQFGRDKLSCYEHCEGFVLPSFSEGLPMVVLEAWSHVKPVLMTKECNLPDGFAANAALRIEPNTESIAEGLKTFLALSDDERAAMGQRGFNLAKNQFAWPKIAEDLRSVYAWVLGRSEQPDCVVRN